MELTNKYVEIKPYENEFMSIAGVLRKSNELEIEAKGLTIAKVVAMGDELADMEIKVDNVVAYNSSDMENINGKQYVPYDAICLVIA